MRRLVLARLALVNAAGFSGSTVMPLWLGGIAAEFGAPPWFAGAAVVAQLGGAAALNLLTPLLFGRAAPLPLARRALAIAAVAYLVAAVHSPAVFLAACLVCGCALGVVLNVTNRLMGSAEHVQRGYATFIIIEVAFATLLFLGCAALIARFGLGGMFPLVSAVVFAGCALLPGLGGGDIATRAASPSVMAPEAAPTPDARGPLCLLSFALFFIGQASLNAFMPTIGQAAGLDVQAARQVIGLGMPFGFVGAMLARLVGERVRPLHAVVLVVLVLAGIALALTAAPGFATFVAGVIALAICTTFGVPYFFAQLGALDRAGRYAAYGPAMMLCGIAAGPAAAVLLDAHYGLAKVGILAVALLLSGGAVFARSTVRR